jgi:hypothetical protein
MGTNPVVNSDITDLKQTIYKDIVSFSAELTSSARGLPRQKDIDLKKAFAITMFYYVEHAYKIGLRNSDMCGLQEIIDSL